MFAKQMHHIGISRCIIELPLGLMNDFCLRQMMSAAPMMALRS